MELPLSTIDLSLVITVALLVIAVIYLEVKMRKLLRGAGSQNISDSINHMKAELDLFQKFQKNLEEYLITVEKRLKRSAQGIHTVRFNPFKGSGYGGDQSFATAILDEEGSGVIISSLYARDRVSVFAKPIVKHASEYELTLEEKEALKNSKQALEL